MILVADFRNDLFVPDVLGYVLIAIGAHALPARSALWSAVVAGVASVIARLSFSIWPDLIQALFEIAMIWFLCTHVLRVAESREDARLARHAANARALTVTVGALNFAYAGLFYGFAIAIPNAGAVLLAFGWSVMAIVIALMLRVSSA